ncbi:hypothetical protein BJY24_005558 [Nocardia transvalensis]|uniref:Diacylglycerol O-acyltransferase n=1 Tax=Nocardia transvalensis TaxID=37333 RepID=A0A7W9PI94_9NOCA|nr:hypothetical protein [Nocardia transvalensis]MBB5916646.1 hypothetical protein [Nocardia transvalensis]
MLDRDGRVGSIAGWTAVDIRPLRRRDRVWRNVPVIKVVRSIRTPDVEVVRTRLKQCAHRHGGDIRWRLLDVDRAVSGRPSADRADEFFRALVVSSAAVSPSIFAGRENDRLDGLPFILTLGHDWAEIRYSHALGDAVSTWDFIGFLLDSGPAPFPAGDRSASAPMPRALLNSFGRSPFRIARAIRMQRELARPVRPATVGDSSLSAGGDGHRFEVAAATSNAGFLNRMRAERDRRYPAASIMSILSVRAMALCRSQGIVVAPWMVMMVDMRRYLPAGMAVDGNFSWSKSIPTPPSNAPRELAGRISKVLESGLPLLICCRAVYSRTEHPEASSARHFGTPESAAVCLMMSYGSKWLDPPASPQEGPPRILMFLPPPGPDFIGVNIIEAGGCVHVSINYRDDILNRESAVLIAQGLVAEPKPVAAAP